MLTWPLNLTCPDAVNQSENQEELKRCLSGQVDITMATAVKVRPGKIRETEVFSSCSAAAGKLERVWLSWSFCSGYNEPHGLWTCWIYINCWEMQLCAHEEAHACNRGPKWRILHRYCQFQIISLINSSNLQRNSEEDCETNGCKRHMIKVFSYKRVLWGRNCIQNNC